MFKSFVKCAILAGFLALFLFAQHAVLTDGVLAAGWVPIAVLALWVSLTFMTGSVPLSLSRDGGSILGAVCCGIGSLVVNVLLVLVTEFEIRGTLIWAAAAATVLIGIARWLALRVDTDAADDHVRRGDMQRLSSEQNGH